MNKFSVFEVPSNVWALAFDFLFGIFEDYDLVTHPPLFKKMHSLMCPLSCVGTKFVLLLSACSFMPVFRALQLTEYVVSSKVHITQLGSRPWDDQTRQCALKACSHQTGTKVPICRGRGIQHWLSTCSNYRGSIKSRFDGCASGADKTIEQWLRESSNYVVVCSTNCLCHVRALLRLCASWRNVHVVRGTHAAPARLLLKIDEIVEDYEAKFMRRFRAHPGQFDALIDRLDVSVDKLNKEDEDEQNNVEMW